MKCGEIPRNTKKYKDITRNETKCAEMSRHKYRKTRNGKATQKNYNITRNRKKQQEILNKNRELSD